MKQLAIIKDVGFGCRDVGKPVLFFTSYVSEASGALQVLFGSDALDFIEKYGVYDIKNLEGKPVWVDFEGCTIKVNSPCIIGGSN